MTSPVTQLQTMGLGWSGCILPSPVSTRTILWKVKKEHLFQGIVPSNTSWEATLKIWFQVLFTIKKMVITTSRT